MKIFPCGISKTAGEDWVVTDESKAMTFGLADAIEAAGGAVEIVNDSELRAQRFPVGDRFVPIRIKVYQGDWSKEIILLPTFFSGGGREFPVPVADKVSTPDEALAGIKSGFEALLGGRMPSPRRR